MAKLDLFFSLQKFVCDISSLKNNLTTILQPHTTHGDFCTLMIVTNLAGPEWVSIPCREKLLCDVMCVIQSAVSAATRVTAKNNTLWTSMCSKVQVLRDGKCYLLLWYQNVMPSHMRKDGLQNFAGSIFQTFQYLFDSVESDFPDMIQRNPDDCTLVNVMKYTRHLSTFRYTMGTTNYFSSEGFSIFVSEKQKIVVGSNIFNCSLGGYVSIVNRCDGQTDCMEDDADEYLCHCDERTDMEIMPDRLCSSISYKQSNKGCGHLYHVSQKGECKLFAFSEENYSEKTQAGVQRTDGIRDFTMQTMQNVTVQTCAHHSKLLCSGHEPVCFSISHICLFEINMNGTLLPCSFGGHLEKCQEFHCNAKFKCRYSYCIPWEYVCNGIWECSSGDDEFNAVCISRQNCEVMYKCKGTWQMCIHLGNVCDGKENCPNNDDEQFCELHKVTCPQMCACLGFAVSCDNTTIIFEEVVKTFVALRVAKSRVQNLNISFCKFSNLKFIALLESGISRLCPNTFPKQLVLLDISINNIQSVEMNCYCSFDNLEGIILDNNEIVFIHKISFVNLPSLSVLSLRRNLLVTVSEDLLFPHLSLKVLDLRENFFSQICVDAFNTIKIEFIVTGDYHICCIAPENTKCTANTPWFVSCSDLLPETTMRAFFIVISSLGFALNGLSILTHSLTWQNNRAFSVHVFFINSGDTLCCIYLLIIWVADLVFQDVFFVAERQWQSSYSCFSAFGLIIWFTLSTQFFLVVLSFSRLLVIICPLKTRFKQISLWIQSLSMFSIISFLISLASSIGVKFVKTKLPTSLCLPFVDPENSFVFIEIMIWISVIGQTLTSLVLIVLHVALVHNISQSLKQMRKVKSHEDSMVMLVLQLVTITLSNMLCWFPANGVFLAAMFLSRYPMDLLIWSTVGSMPLNSVINPLIFSVLCIKKMMKSKFGVRKMSLYQTKSVRFSAS